MNNSLLKSTPDNRINAAIARAAAYPVKDYFWLTRAERKQFLAQPWVAAIANSKLMAYYLDRNGCLTKRQRVLQLRQGNFTLPPTTPLQREVLANLYDYITYIRGLGEAAERINQYAPNSFLIEAFQEVIDTLVMELYFPAELAANGVVISGYAWEIFRKLSDADPKRDIERFYQLFRRADDPLRNSLKLMAIRCEELVMSIRCHV